MSKLYTPNRNDIILIDFEPTKGKEIGKYRPALVLSSVEYAKTTGLIICCPISTSIRGAATEVPVNNLDKPSVVASSLIQTMDWRRRQVRFVVQAEKDVMFETVKRVIPLIGGDTVIERLLEDGNI